MKIASIDQIIYDLFFRAGKWLSQDNKTCRTFRFLVHQFLVGYASKAPIAMLVFIGILSIQKWSVNHSWNSLIPAAGAIAAAIISRLLNGVIRFLIYRPRPHIAYASDPLLLHPPSSSFPSNHAAGAFALAVAMGGSGSLSQLILLGMAVLLCLTRLYVRLHYFSDVVAGAIIGTGCSLFVLMLVHTTA